MSDQKNKTYLFKFNFADMPSYRNFKVVAKTDSEAQAKISKEFFQNPYVYLLEGEKVHEKIRKLFQFCMKMNSHAYTHVKTDT